MAAANVSGFEYRGTFFGGLGTPPRRVEFFIKDAETIREGDMLNGEAVSGVTHVDLAAAGDTGLIGIADEYKVSASAGGTLIRVITNVDAIYAVYDNAARKIGDALKLGTGGSGAQTVVAADKGDDDEFIVIADSTADEWTLVTISPRASLLITFPVITGATLTYVTADDTVQLTLTQSGGYEDIVSNAADLSP